MIRPKVYVLRTLVALGIVLAASGLVSALYPEAPYCARLFYYIDTYADGYQRNVWREGELKAIEMILAHHTDGGPCKGDNRR